MNSKKLLTILISVLMMCALLTACGGSDSSSGQPSAEDNQQQTYDESDEAEDYGVSEGDDRAEKLGVLQALYDTLVTVHNGSATLINQCQEYDVEVSDELIDSFNNIKVVLDEYRETIFADDAVDALDLDGSIAGIEGDIDAVIELNAIISSRLEELGLELEYTGIE